MIVRSVVVLALLVSGLIGPPATGAPAPANSVSRATAAASAPAPAGATPVNAMATATKRKPRAAVSASYVVLGSGKVRVTVTSNAKKVKLTYRTAKNKKRATTITIRKGKGAKTLAKGSKRIVAQAKATSKLRTGIKTPVRAYVPPVVTPPVVTPPVVTPPPVKPPVVTPPPATDTTPPGPVTGLAVTSTTTESISLSWTNPTDTDLAEVIVRRATGATPPASPTTGTPVPLPGPKETGVTDSGLAAATQYAYAVFTRDPDGNTSPAVTRNGTTAAAADTTPAGPVTGLTMTAATPNSISLSWTNPTDTDLAEVIVRRAAGDTPPASTASGTAVPLPTPTATSVTDPGLTPETQYVYSVFTRDNTGNTAEPATVSARTAAVLDPIQVTSLLQVPVGSAVGVDLPTVTNVSQIEVGTSPAGVSWSTSGGALWVSVAMTSALGPGTARLGGTGCIAEVCDLKLAITVDVTVIGVEAPASAILDELTLPSSGRVSTAQLLPAGAGSNLVDEVTVVLGTADAPGTRSAADAVAAAVDAVVAGGLERLGIYQLRWYAGQDIDARIVEILAIPGVAGVDRGLILTDPTTALPDGDWDDDAMDGTWHLRQMRAPEAWDVTSSTFRDPAAGSSVVVGIVDGGLVARHSDLNSARWVSIGAGVIGDHATHVAGLACARQNGSGVVGAAWGCPILSDAAVWPGFDDYRENAAFSLSTALMGAERVVAAGAKVVNMSLGINTEAVDGNTCASSAVASEISNWLKASDGGASDLSATSNGFRRLAEGAGKDVVFTLAAGNRCAPGVWSPFGAAADLDNVITVSAVNSDGQLSSFSNWGAEVAAGGGVSVPPMLNRSGATVSGETGVWSTVSDDGYGAMAGTSMAAPLVAGVAALVREQHPDMGAAQVGRCIVVSAGARTSIARTRGDYPAAGIDPLIAYDEAIPITDAATAIDCGLDPPTDQAGAEYIARDPSTSRSVLVANGVVKNIPNGGTFLCLAETRLVWNIANLKALAQTPTGNAACDNTGRTEWDIRPGVPPDGGNIGTSVLLRDTAGQVSLINQTGEVQAVVDLLGGVRKCLESRHPIIWDADPTKVADWEPAGVPLLACPTSSPDLVPETITAGQSHTCALDKAGKAWCWGDNTLRGAVNLPPGLDMETPSAVDGGRSYSQISAGGSHTCALDPGGQIWCWGTPDLFLGSGIGDGTLESRPTPVRGGGDRTYTQVAAGGAHTCALDAEGKAWCWGAGGYGQLGDGSAWRPDATGEFDYGYPSRLEAVAVTGNHTYSTIEAGFAHTCALDMAGKAWCWGGPFSWGWARDPHPDDPDNTGPGLPPNHPEEVLGGHTYTSITSGGFHVCAVTETGQGWCWGGNDAALGSGEHPEGWVESPLTPPLAVSGDHQFASISAGHQHTCAVDATSQAWCWGEGSGGELGNGDDVVRVSYVPSPVADDHSFTKITAGAKTCAVDTAGQAWCWGTRPGYAFGGSRPYLVAGDHDWL